MVWAGRDSHVRCTCGWVGPRIMDEYNARFWAKDMFRSHKKRAPNQAIECKKPICQGCVEKAVTISRLTHQVFLLQQELRLKDVDDAHWDKKVAEIKNKYGV